MWHVIQHWLTVHTGSSNTAGTPPNYNFYSGAGSDIAELAIVGGLVSVYRKHNCHVHGCWRIGRHQTAGGHVVCRPHNPAGPVTHQDVIDAHHAAKRGGQP
jgi:hypothetical protein